MRKIFIGACCTRCGSTRKLSRHHPLPRRFYGIAKNQWIIILCDNCHRGVEEVLYFLEMNPKTGERVRLAHHEYIMLAKLLEKHHGQTNP